MIQTYEAMFLMNPNVVAEWAAGEAEIRRLLERAEAKIIGLKRWDERKLAYEIEGHKRGTYGLTFFEADGSKISALERDAQLSESILRLLVLRMEKPTPEKIEKALSAAPAKPYERFEPRDRGPGEFSGRGDYGGRSDRGPSPRAVDDAVEPIGEPAI